MYFNLGTGNWILGAEGEAGIGVPSGGTAGQIISKVDGTDFNTDWIDPPIAVSYGVADITGLTSELAGKVDNNQVLTNVPSGAVFIDTTYSNLSEFANDTNFITLADIPASASAWGDLTGTLSNQTDLQNALDAKSDTDTTYTNLSEFVNDTNFIVLGDVPAAATVAQGTKADSALQNITGESIKSLSDVFSTMVPADGQILTYDTTNGWQAQNAPEGGVVAWGDLTGTLSNQTDLQSALDGKVDDGQVLTNVPAGALFTDTNTVYNDTTIQAEVDLNTAKVSNIAHPLVETAVPVGALFTDTDTNTTYTALSEFTNDTNFITAAEILSTPTEIVSAYPGSPVSGTLYILVP
jgi:hypothetical protein